VKSLPDSALSTLPSRIDWISVNPKQTAKFPELGQKTYIWILPGKITQGGSKGAVVAGQVTIPAGAELDLNKIKTVPDGAFSSVADSPDNMYVPLTGPQVPVPAKDLTPAQKLELYKEAVKEYNDQKGHAPATPC
jgi:hypothetical protein